MLKIVLGCYMKDWGGVPTRTLIFVLKKSLRSTLVPNILLSGGYRKHFPKAQAKSTWN